MDRAQTIQLPLVPPDCDHETASRYIQCLGGLVCVQIDPDPTAKSVIRLPDRLRGHSRPDAGVVLSVGPEVEGLSPGEHVLIRPYKGEAFEGFEAGEFITDQMVKFIGLMSPDEHERQFEDWDLAIVAKLQGKEIRPIGHWLFIRRDPEKTSEGGVLLPDREKYRSQKCTVIAAGDKCSVKPGTRLTYHAKGLVVDLEFGEEFGLDGNPKDYAFIHEENNYCVVVEDPEVVLRRQVEGVEQLKEYGRIAQGVH